MFRLTKWIPRVSGTTAATWRLVLLSLTVGVIAGLGAIAFFALVETARHAFLGFGANYYPDGPGGEPPLFVAHGSGPVRRGALALLPALGGLLSGILVWRLAREAGGHGTDAAIEAYHYHDGRIRTRVPFVKAVASALTIGSGGSGGSEGPIAQIGSGFGSWLAHRVGCSARETRALMAAGMAAGVGAIFHAPMAGALFAAEVLYRDLDLEYEALIPGIIASIVAYAIFCMRFGWEPLFITPDFGFRHALQLAPYAALAATVAAGAWLYIRCFYTVEGWFRRSRIPPWLRPAVGGLAVGAIGVFLPDALGTGYGVLQRALVAGSDLATRFSSISLPLLLAVAAGKILTTSLSIGSGGSGGIFGPALVIGGALGGAVGLVAQSLLPGLHIEAGAFALVGMAGFFAAAAKTPLSTVIMVSEVTGNYRLLVPSLWVCIIAYLLLQRHTLYVKQVWNRFASPVHQGHMIEAVLTNLHVRDVLPGTPVPLATVQPTTPVRELLRHYAQTPQSTFPVVDDAGRVTGMVSGGTVRALVQGGGGFDLVMIAEDLAVPAAVTTRDASLLDAVHAMRGRDLTELIVVDDETPARPLAILNHSDIVSAYDHAVDASDWALPGFERT